MKLAIAILLGFAVIMLGLIAVELDDLTTTLRLMDVACPGD